MEVLLWIIDELNFANISQENRIKPSDIGKNKILYNKLLKDYFSSSLNKFNKK